MIESNQIDQITDEARRTFFAFISYRHLDNENLGRHWAEWLHHCLEGYRVPDSLRGKPNRSGENIPRSIYPVFRDQEEMAGARPLGELVEDGLRRSRWLIVLCSPRSAESPWVNSEIERFREMGKSQRIILALIDGEPNAIAEARDGKNIDPKLECLPRALRRQLGNDSAPNSFASARELLLWNTQDLYADFRPAGKPNEGFTSAAAYRDLLERENELRSGADRLDRTRLRDLEKKYAERLRNEQLKIVASILDVDLGELTRRDAESRARRFQNAAIFAAVFSCVLIALSAWAVHSRNRATEALQTAKRNMAQVYWELARRAQKNETDSIGADSSVLRAVHLLLRAGQANAAGRNTSGVRDDLLAARWAAAPVLASLLHSVHVATVTNSPDNRLILTCSEDPATSECKLQIWDANDGTPLGRPVVRHRNLNGCFSPDSNMVLSWNIQTNFSTEIQEWFVTNGAPAGPIINVDEAVSGITYAPDGRSFAVWGNNGVRIWRARDHSSNGPPIFPENAWSPLRSASFSPDSKRLLSLIRSAEGNVVIQLWNPQTCAEVGQPIHLSESASEIEEYPVFSPDSRHFLTWSSGAWSRHSEVHLWDADTGNSVRVLYQDDRRTLSAIFNKQGSRILTSGEKSQSDPKHSERVLPLLGYIELWDARDGHQITSFMTNQPVTPIFDGRIGAVFNNDGRLALTWNNSNGVGEFHVWRAQDGAPDKNVLYQAGGAGGATFSPSDQLLMTWNLSKNTELWLWSLSNGQCLRKNMFQPNMKDGVFSPDDGLFLSRAEAILGRGEARLWNVYSGREVGQPWNHVDRLSEAKFMSGGTRVATWSTDANSRTGTFGEVRLWIPTDGLRASQPMRYPGPVIGGKFSGNGRHLLGWSLEQTISSTGYRINDYSRGEFREWNLINAVLAGKPILHTGIVRGAVYNDAGTMVASWSDDMLRFWRSADTTNIVNPITRKIGGAAFFPDGQRALAWPNGTIEGGNSAWLLCLTNGHLVEQTLNCDYPITAAAISPDGDRILACAGDMYNPEGEARLWRVGATGAVEQSTIRLTNGIVHAFFVQKGQCAVIWTAANGSNLGEIEICDASNGRQIGTPIRPEGGLKEATSSSDGQFVFTKNSQGTGRVWNIETRKPGSRIQPEHGLRSAGFSPGGQKLFTISQYDFDGGKDEIQLWESPSGLPIGHPMKHGGPIVDVSVSSDNRWLLSASSDRTAKIWSTENANLLVTIRQNSGITSASFSLSARRVLTTCSDGLSYLWDTSIDPPITADDYGLEFEIRSGTTLGKDGTLQVLDQNEWETRKQRLLEMQAHRSKKDKTSP